MDEKPDNIRETDEYKEWFADLRDKQAQYRILTRIRRLAIGNPGDHRFLGDISELKIDYGPGYRVYYSNQRFADTGKIIYVLLCSGDKSTQNKDIEKARELAQNLEGIV